MLKARSLAESAVSSSQCKNLSAFQDLIDAAIFLSFVSERSGDLRAALEYRQEHIAAARKELEADPRTPLLRRGFSNSNAAAARLQSLIDPKAVVSPLDLAVGWTLHASRCTSVSLYPCAEEAAKGVEIARAVVAANPTSEARNTLAEALDQLGSSSGAASRRVTGTARKTAIERELAALTECQQMIAGIERAGGKPDTDTLNLGLLGLSIETAKEKLAELQKATASSQR